MGGYIRRGLNAAFRAGAKLLVIDPRKTDSAGKADLWIRPRPAADGVLAMGIIKVLIEENLFDADFIANWAVGFEELQQHVGTFSLEEVEALTWVPVQQIKECARLYARHKPVCLVVGNGMERSLHAFQQMRAVFIMRALVGDVNTPGGNISLKPASYTRPGRFFQLKDSPRLEKIKGGRVVGKEFKLAMSSAYVPTQSLIKAILDEKPNPIKAAICILSNPIISYPDSEATHKALTSLDFFVVSELFPTPTTAIADIVLPAAWGAEHDTVGYWPGWFGEIRAYPKVVDPPGEARSDMDWINELGNRLGLGEYFWEDVQEVLDHMLEPSGLSWEDFKEKRIFHAQKEYKRYEEGIFKTPSGKVEIVSKQLEDLGYSPMPRFEELSRFRFDASAKYPLLLFNSKEGVYMLTGYKHVEALRDMKRQPTVEMNPSTAEESGLKEGDWITIETNKGRVKQILSLDPDLDPKLVHASFGWWFPEEKDDLFQFRKSNLNILTESDGPYDQVTGCLEFGGIPCRVYKT